LRSASGDHGGSDEKSQGKGVVRLISFGWASENLIITATASWLRAVFSGDSVLLRPAHGDCRGICSLEEVWPGCLQAYWPAASSLLDQVLDPENGEPDYNVLVSVRKA